MALGTKAKVDQGYDGAGLSHPQEPSTGVSECGAAAGTEDVKNSAVSHVFAGNC